MKGCLAIPIVLVLCVTLPAAALADSRRLAVIVGNNSSVDEELDSLKFADDDAFKYAEFFSFFADKVYLLTRVDDESRALYEGAKATPPTRRNVLDALDKVVAKAGELAMAGDEVTVYFLFSGHGNYDAEGRGYLHLEDGKLTTRDLFYSLVGHTHSFQLVLLIDACNASFLVNSRGSSSDRRPAGPPTLEMERYENVGLILSSSSVGEVKEWGRILAGIFSHQIRSALTGVADVDGDGRITFQELASFVEASNRGVDNPALKLTPYIRPPLANPNMPLIDFKSARFPATLRMDFKADSRVTVFDARLLRYADFHLAGGYPVNVALAGRGDYFVSVGDKEEFMVPAGTTGVVELSSLERRDAPALASRGIDQYYVKHLFSQPYGREFAAEYLRSDYEPGLVFVRRYEQPRYKNKWGWISLGLGVTLLNTGGVLGMMAQDEREAGLNTDWGDEKARHNATIDLYNDLTLASAIAGGVAIATSLAFFILDQPVESRTIVPKVGPGFSLTPTLNGAMLEGRF